MQMIDYFGSQQRAKKAYERILEPVCGQWGLSRAEVDILLFLFNNPGLDRAADIVERRGLAKSHVSTGLAALEERGLVTRQVDAADRRAIRLKLTKLGTAVAEDARIAQRSFFFSIYEGITPEEFAVWQRIMEKVSDNIQKL